MTNYAQTDTNYTYHKHENFKCRKCGSQNVKKNGKNRYGNQQYYCKECHASGVLEPKIRYTEKRKLEILDAYQKLPNMRGIARMFQISRHTLAKWLKNSQA